MKYLFLLSLFVLGCTSQKEQNTVFHNLDNDFPNTETLAKEELGNYELYGIESMVTKDSLLFVLERGSQANFGRCFNINTGKVISTLTGKGRANNEMLHLTNYSILGDSLQAISCNHPTILNLYSIKDIVEKKPSNPRSVYFPDTVHCLSLELIDQARIFGSPQRMAKSNNAKYVLFDGQELHNVGELNKELMESNVEITNNDLRFTRYSLIKQDEKLVVVSNSAIQLEIINLANLEIEKNRYYTKRQLKKEEIDNSTFMSSNSEYHTEQIGCNSDYIYILYCKYNKLSKPDFFILKFDWNLTPIVKYAIEYCSSATFSENCDYLYAFAPSSDKELETLIRYKL